MKEKSLKWIGLLGGIAVVSTAATIFVFQPWKTTEKTAWNYSSETLRSLSYENLLAAAPVEATEANPGEVRTAGNEVVELVSPSSETTPKEESKTEKTTAVVVKKTDSDLLKELKSSANKDLDKYLKSTSSNLMATNLEVEEVNSLDATKDTSKKINENLGGYGTYTRQKVERNGHVSDNTFNPGAQESTETMIALIKANTKFKKLKSGVKINSEDFKYVAVNSLVSNGEEFLNIQDADKQAAVDTMNKDLEATIKKATGVEKARWEEWKKVAGERTVENLTNQEISWLKQGMLPTSAFSWALRPAFVNTHVYNQALKNAGRYISSASSSQLGQDDLYNLNFNGNSAAAEDKWNQSVQTLKDQDKNKVVLRTYTKTVGEKTETRHLVEIKDPTDLDINTVMEVAKSQVTDQDKEFAVAIRDITKEKLEATATIVKALPKEVKSLTLFYRSDDPKALNALLENTNFTSEAPLGELNVVGPYQNGNPIPKSEILTTVDPQVFVKVKQGAFSYGSSVVYTKFTVAASTDKALLENIFKLVYIKDKNRREFQGEFGSGGYIVNWDLSKTELKDLNNIVFPQRDEKQPLKFKLVTFASTENKILQIDLSDLKVDNTDKISEHGSAMYGKDPEKQPEKLVLAKKSSRSTKEDIDTLVRIFNYSHTITTIDLSDVESYTQEAVKDLFKNVKRTVTVKVNKGEFTVQPEVKEEARQ
ncbi:hypothetical protein ACW95P_03815 [Candidatus Mycoplasma pogonae]